MTYDELTPPERRVWDAFPAGTAVDFRAAPEEDPAEGADWGPERTVRGEALRALLLTHPTTAGEVAKVDVRGARISGQLDLRHGDITCPVHLTHCSFDAQPDLYAARLGELHLWRSVLPGLSAVGAQFESFVALSECRATGMVSFSSARIARTLYLDRLSVESARAEERGVAVALNHTVIGDAVVATALSARGEVRLDGATVTAQVAMSSARLHNPGGIALNAKGLTVGSDLTARGLHAQGSITLRSARIPGQLDLTEARLSSPDGMALRVSSAAIGEMWLRDATPIEGTVNLRRTQLQLLHAEPAVWPEQVRLGEFTYTTLLPHLPAADRLPLLVRDEYLPHAYQQLTAAYQRVGDDTATRLVQLAAYRRHRTTLPAYARAWSWVQDITVGYGFRPLRAAAWLGALLLIGTIAYALHHPRPLKSGEAPDFNPLFYTFDLLLPIIGFGQESAYAPHGGYQWLSYALIISGWLLVTTIVAGITRAISRP
ncbi:membrane-associated oxidoreductase [Streptomyces sp. RTd22]|uniref:membrane-associated oxidoreductase n=1 Tax=Streptomyces sp. RTd22 TaxID=1841249 RepID=UPI000D1C027B|nr:membrane-associated oxidoreductase [Streptomyces sp. RTd22]